MPTGNCVTCHSTKGPLINRTGLNPLTPSRSDIYLPLLSLAVGWRKLECLLNIISLRRESHLTDEFLRTSAYGSSCSTPAPPSLPPGLEDRIKILILKRGEVGSGGEDFLTYLMELRSIFCSSRKGIARNFSTRQIQVKLPSQSCLFLNLIDFSS